MLYGLSLVPGFNELTDSVKDAPKRLRTQTMHPPGWTVERVNVLARISHFRVSDWKIQQDWVLIDGKIETSCGRTQESVTLERSTRESDTFFTQELGTRTCAAEHLHRECPQAEGAHLDGDRPQKTDRQVPRVRRELPHSGGTAPLVL